MAPMVGGGRRVRRMYHGGRGTTTSSSSVLPTTVRTPERASLSHTLSCWYCDLKLFAFNTCLFSIGQKHSRFLRIWFAIGTGFGITALFGVTLILVGELAATLIPAVNVFSHNFYSTTILFGFLPSSVSGFTLSLIDTGYILFSTFISVALHEFGHAIAAASEGVHIQYIAIYIAVLFPGALVAFNYDSLQLLPQLTVLRIYCAGIWHNAVCCAACALALFLLPLILYPLFTHGENPMVLDVTPTSPLSSYLSPGDIIESLDGLKIGGPEEWKEILTLMNEQSLQNPQHSSDSYRSHAETSMKGYCIPSAWMGDNKKSQMDNDRLSCPDGLTAFSSVSCFNLNVLDDKSSENGHRSTEVGQCFNAGGVVQLKKCGNGWQGNGTSGGNCVCSQEEACLGPILVPGLTWVEISYKRPYSSDCLWLERNLSSVSGSPQTTNCGGVFVFIGDTLSLENSVYLTAYQPRWAVKLALGLPNFVEKLLACTFHVSLTLTLLNSLPVFLLDGESILEVIIGCIPFLNSRKRTLVLQISLLGGTLLSILAFSRVFFNFLVPTGT